MVLTFTFKNNKIIKPLCILTLLILNYAAHTQTTKFELEQQMQALYKNARQLYADLPNRDKRGNYFSMAIGISPFGHIKTWKVEEVCDCDGNVIGTQNVTTPKFPIAWSLGWENRLTNVFSFRLMGSHAHLSHGKDANVVSESGNLTQMKDAYQLRQYGLQASAIVHLDNFYSGVGMSRTQTRASGFQTMDQKNNYHSFQEDTPPQYFNLKADVTTSNIVKTAPHLFVGYRLMWSPDVFGSVELGFVQNIYFNFQLNFPLSPHTKKSLREWQSAHQEYNNVLKQAESIDRYLNPEKFQVSTCTIGDSTGGGSCN